MENTTQTGLWKDDKAALVTSSMQPLIIKSDSLPGPAIEDRKPKRAVWRRAVRIALTGVVCYWVVKAVVNYSFTLDLEGPDDWKFDVDEHALLQGSEDMDWPPRHPPHEDVNCDDLQGPQWTYLTTLSETKTWNLSTSAEKIKIFTRGPIAGNLTFTSGKTVGDDVEVDVKVVKSPHLCHHRSDDEPTEPAPPPPPPQPLVKVCPITSRDGKFEGLGIFAIRRRRHPGPGHPPHCPDGSCPHEPHEPEPDHPDEPPSDGDFVPAVHPPSRPSPSHPHGPAPPPPPAPGRPPRRRPAIVFANIDVRLPTSSSVVKTLILKNFELLAPNFKLDIGDLRATFESLVLVSTNAPITVKGASAAVLAVVSPGGNITGSFSVSKRLDIASIGRTIDVNVALFSAPHDKAFNATRLKINSRFGSIKANISLIASSDEASVYPPGYFVEAVNVKGPTNITFASQPLNSTLVTSVTGIGGQATVKADPAFQGFFDLISYGSRPIFVVPEDTKDPWGGNNKRVVSFFKTWGWWNLKGVVYWKAPETVAEHDNPLSTVKIVTKGAPASLYLG